MYSIYVSSLIKYYVSILINLIKKITNELSSKTISLLTLLIYFTIFLIINNFINPANFYISKLLNK